MSTSTDARVVLDATLLVTPAADAGLPLQLGPGHLMVTARQEPPSLRASSPLLNDVATTGGRPSPPPSGVVGEMEVES